MRLILRRVLRVLMTVILMMWRIGLRIKDFMPWSLVRCSHWLRVEKNAHES